MRTLFLSLLVASLLYISPLGKAIQDDSLVLYLPFDEGSGKEVKDLSQYGNDGAIEGKPKWVEGKFEKALELDGVADWVQVKDSSSLRVFEEVTVMAWIKPERYTFPGHDWQGIIAKANNPRSYSFYTHTSGRFLLAIHFGGQHFVGWSNGNGVPLLKEWSHVAAVAETTKQNGTMRLFMNGKLTKETPFGELKGLPGDSDTSDVVIGRTWEGSRFFLGLIDEVAIYNRVLKEREIKQDMEKGILSAAVGPSGKLTTTWGEIKCALE